MEALDQLLESRHVDLDVAEEETDLEPGSENRRQSMLGLEKQAESILRQDVVAPRVIQFTPTYNASRKARRWTTLIVTLTLSIVGLIHYRKIVPGFSHEQIIDIEKDMVAATGVDPIKHTNSSVFNKTWT